MHAYRYRSHVLYSTLYDGDVTSPDDSTAAWQQRVQRGRMLQTGFSPTVHGTAPSGSGTSHGAWHLASLDRAPRSGAALGLVLGAGVARFCWRLRMPASRGRARRGEGRCMSVWLLETRRLGFEEDGQHSLRPNARGRFPGETGDANIALVVARERCLLVGQARAQRAT
jgi:hypothetical protein